VSASDFDFIATRDEIISAAYRKIGVISFGDSLTSEQAVEGIFALQQVVKDWQNKNVFLWTRQLLTETLVAATATYVPTDPAIIGIEEAFLRDVDGNDRPIRVISFSDYQNIEKKAEAGMPEAITFNNRQNCSISVWPVPTTSDAADYTLHYVGISRIKDMDNANDSGDIPSRYQRALIYDLAVELAPDHAIPGSEIDRLEARADRIFQQAKNNDRDTSDTEEVASLYSCRRGY